MLKDKKYENLSVDEKLMLIDGKLNYLEKVMAHIDEKLTKLEKLENDLSLNKKSNAIEEVINNYISNALNHVSGDNIIKIAFRKKEEVVRVSVYNTGENIPEDEINNVWIKFYKVDKARTREYGGSGIGLSIVKAIMESMNKECGVVNHEDGVEFWFEVDRKNA